MQYTTLPQNDVSRSDHSHAKALHHSMASRSGRQEPGTDPSSVLQQSIKARANWSQLQLADLTNPTDQVGKRTREPSTAGTPDPSVTNSLPSANEAPDAAQAKLDDDYDREAAMDRLVTAGENAAKLICRGC